MESITTHSFKGEKPIPKQPQSTTEFLAFSHTGTHTRLTIESESDKHVLFGLTFLSQEFVPGFPHGCCQRGVRVFFLLFSNVIDRFNLLVPRLLHAILQSKD